jgi:hypothetical protein
MKTITVLLASLLIATSAFADQAVSVYKPNSNGSTTRGCSQVVFIMQGVFSGTIGNATFSTAASTQTVIPISAVGSNQMLSAIPYTLAGAGSLIIIETK